MNPASMCMRQTSATMPVLRVLLFVLVGGLPSTDAFVIQSIEHRPTMIQNVSTGKALPYAPVDLRQQRLSENGNNPAVDTSVRLSRFQHVGCFRHAMSITTSALMGVYRDPNDCIEECKAQEMYKNVPSNQLIVAVHNDPLQGRCGCALKKAVGDFDEAEDGAGMCTYQCKAYLNPICGGFPDYWGIFMEYDQNSMSAQGAYDPWRYVFYTVVSFKEKTIRGRYPPDGVVPERYYLNAVDVDSGRSRFEFQMKLSGILYGLEYDIDSTRLVALLTNFLTGRMRTDLPWQYKLAVILVNTTNKYRPYMQLSTAPIGLTEVRAAVPDATQLVSPNYMAYSGASAIFSKLTNCYVFTQAHYSALKYQMKDRVYVVRIPDGFIIREEPIDFKVTALYSNQQFGDLSAIGPRLDVSFGGGRQSYVYLGRIYRSAVESRTLVDWAWSPINPQFLADPDIIGDFRLYPGVATTDHLFNKSAIAHRFKTANNSWGAFTLSEVGIRPPFLFNSWCNASTADSCQGTLDKNVPFSSIFNREPGIPLSLQAPSFVIPARFNMDASAIIVNFDRSTLQGARQIDINGDFVPDEIDTTLQRQVPFDCGELFALPSTYKIGLWPGTTCLWKSNSQVRINLGHVNISVGDSIFILPDALYAVNVKDDWSPAASGGVQIGLPDPLEYPVIIPSGSNKVDQCTPVRLDVDSLLDGSLATWSWNWIEPAEGAPNPEDLASRAGFSFDPARLQTFQDYLVDATAGNNKSLQMPSGVLEEAAKYRFQVSVTSRWNLTANYTFDLQKLAFPAPTVYIEGPPVVWRNRTQSLSLVAMGAKSLCAPADQALAYRWLVTGQEYAKTGIPLDFKDHPDILTVTNVLIVPENVLEPTTEAEWNSYNFTVQCYVNSEFGNVPEKTASATVEIRIRQSPIIVQMSVYDRLLTISDVLVLDAKSTMDPDYPPASVGLTFPGTFEFRCLTPPPERRPCWDPRRLQEAGLQVSSDGFVKLPRRAQRRLQATDGFVSQEKQISPCRKDVGSKFTDGGFQYYTPLFDDQDYCGDSRGVLMVQTLDFIVGSYKFTIRATEYDGRKAELDCYIEMVTQRVPRMVLKILNPNNYLKFPVTEDVNIFGSEESAPSDDKRTYTWSFFVFESNPAYSPELAKEALNNADNPYTVDEFIYVDKTGTQYTATDNTKFKASVGSPDLVILKNALQASKRYKVRLNVNLAAVSGYAEVGFETAGLAPRNGKLEVNPRVGSLEADRVLSALNWQSDDSPLTYEFGYYKFRPGKAEPSKMAFSSAPSQVKNFEIKSLPAGTLDTNGNYTIPVYVKVCTPFNACTILQVIIISNPPANPADAAAGLLGEAKTLDPGQAMIAYDAVMSVAGNNNSVQNSILDGLLNTPLSPDVIAASQRAALLSSMVTKGAGTDMNTAERVMNELEGLVTMSADANLFNPQNSLAGDALNAMGGLMPGASQMSAGASGMSVSMGRYKAPSQAIGASAASTNAVDLSSAATRQRSNHPMPLTLLDAITECPTAFCDLPGLWCFDVSNEQRIRGYRCCNSRNPNTLCDEPPCWFGGNACPVSGTATAAAVVGGGLSQDRRLQAAAGSKGGIGTAKPAAFVTAAMVSTAAVAASQTVGSSQGVAVPSKVPAVPAVLAGKRALQGGKSGEGWFDSWVSHNFPLNGPHHSEVSDHDRIRGFHGWHPEVHQRRLEFMSVNDTVSPAVRLQALEDAEIPLVTQARNGVKKAERADLKDVAVGAELQLQFAEMSLSVANRLKAETVNREIVAAQTLLQSNRNDSQRITRIVVMRDTICKSLIKGMARNSPPVVFDTLTFRLTMGKTPDLTSTNENFSFPAPYFKRPADSPDEPAPNRSLTGFSYIYVEYMTNIYSWSSSNPISNDSAVVTLIALQANTKDLDLTSVNPPIKLFRQFDVYANAICLYWDRFAPDTAGGAWSSQGVMNDGDSCITTHLSDIAIFVDGTVPSGSTLVDAATSWSREVWESHCIGCDSGSNLFPVTALGMMLFTMALFILLGYVQDERKRMEMKRNKVKSRYFFDGDGLTTPLNVDDPISYAMRDVNISWFWIGTFVNVALREHGLISPIFYHETFTRPQRLLCMTALMCGLLAVNAAIHSNPGSLQKAKELEGRGIMEPMISGLLSGLLMFPVYCGLLMMFNMRPSQVKKRLIKKTYSTRELDLINEQRQKLAHQTAMLPQPGPGYLALPPSQAVPGATTLLNLPAPLPLPPLPVGGGKLGMPGMFALPPPMPAGGMGATGMLALPMPGMSANMPLPPPPRYPPPPKNAKVPSPAALMPPLNWPKVGPPPTPFPALTAPDASIGGTHTNLPMMGSWRLALTPPDTGATPMLTDSHMHYANMPGYMDTEMHYGGATMQDDVSHGMMPPMDLPGSMPQPRGPPGSFYAESQTPPMPGSGMYTPPGGPPGAGVGPLSPVSSRALNFTGMQYGGGAPGPVTHILPHNAVPPPLFIRGQPPPCLPSPFPPMPAGPSGMTMWVPPGMMPPGMGPPVGAAFGGSNHAGLPGAFGMPGFPPAPPPPPREDNEAFVRRIKLTYMDKVTKEHDKYDLLEDYDELGKDVPFWVFDTMTVMPYLAACTFTLAAIFVVLQYSVKFQPWQETYWLTGTIVGLLEILLVLEMFRIVMMTLVELRKFENRRKAKAGDFLPRRVRRPEDADFQPAPAPRLWKRAVAPPQVPKGKPPAPRPAFLPKQDMPAPPSRMPPSKAPSMMGPPPNGPPGGFGRIPIAPARPPVFSSAAMSRAGALDEPPPPATPHSITSNPNPRMGSMTPPGGAFTPPRYGGANTPPFGGGGGGGRPSLATAAELARYQQQSHATPGLPSPAHSLHSLAKSLNQQVQAGRHAEAPPPPSAQPGASPATGAAPPRAPAAPPPSYSRPPSRPTSANNVAKAPPPRP